MRGTAAEFGTQLATGYWASKGTPARHWDIPAGGTLTVHLGGLNSAGRKLAEAALSSWTAVTGIQFREISSGEANITFDDSDSIGSNTKARFYTTGEMVDVKVNIPASLVAKGANIGGEAFEAYVHEIGHAIGLGHPGNYNTNATLPDRIWSNDTTMMSIMSYFDSTQSSDADLGYARAITPMAGDLVAINLLYGATAINEGNTVYGSGGNVSGPMGEALDILTGPQSATGTKQGFLFTIADTGGTDLVSFSGQERSVKIDLREGAWSTVEGWTGGFTIADGSIVENARGGAKADTLIGNTSANFIVGEGGGDRIYGGSGNDQIYGGWGYDRLDGGAGADILGGGSGNDTLLGRAGNDALRGDAGRDRLYGGEGHDRMDGGAGADLLAGGLGNDTLIGRDGNDTLRGESGNDVFYGGTGNDWLAGGAGADRFVFGGAFGKDHIADLAREDRVDLSGVASITSFSDMTRNHLDDTGRALVIYDGAGNTITLEGLHARDISAELFIF